MELPSNQQALHSNMGVKTNILGRKKEGGISWQMERRRFGSNLKVMLAWSLHQAAADLRRLYDGDFLGETQ